MNDKIGIAKRQNNPKRTFLIVNKRQAKHIPVDPQTALFYFKELGQLVASTCSFQERVLVIGFCETATAIGAAVAKEIPNATYCHTTRENMGDKPLVRFLEEHSHAVNQNLYLQGELKNFDRIVFVDDEITTGKTILNFIKALKQDDEISFLKFTVAGLIFAKNAKQWLSDDVDQFCYLDQLEHQPAELNIVEKEAAIFPHAATMPPEIQISGLQNPRIELTSACYETACLQFAAEVIKKIAVTGVNILVLGTEEFMYPALILAQQIQQDPTAASDRSVVCHATSRSPIVPSAATGYPIQNQCCLTSFYETERKTYVYNLCQYDEVIVVTDSIAFASPTAYLELAGALKQFGNDKITLVRWIK
jgi:adenine/guanine phosphoribosyltransferase-like PRPP-binding protein